MFVGFYKLFLDYPPLLYGGGFLFVLLLIIILIEGSNMD